MLSLRRTLVLIVVVVLAAVSLTSVAAAERRSGDPRPQVGPPSAYDAPIGARGGAMNPYASCGDSVADVARMKWVLKNTKTGKKVRFGWFDAYPGTRFPRLAVGTWASHTVAKCGSTKVSRRDRFTIHQKTRKSTISKAEFNQVEKGMTLREVRTIVGNKGVWPFTSRGTTGRTFHQMRFWAWSIIYFEQGRVTEKYWNVGHD